MGDRFMQPRFPIEAEGLDLKLGDQHANECLERYLPSRQVSLVELNAGASQRIDLYFRRCRDMEMRKIGPGKDRTGLPVVNEELSPISVQDSIQIRSNVDRP